MFKKSYLLIISFIITFSFTLAAQQPVNVVLPVDTIKNKAAIELCKKILANDKSDPLFNHVSVFGNPDCAHCRDVEALMKEKNIAFDVYDLRDNNLLISIHDVIAAKNSSQKMAYSFPIILYKGEAYFNFKDANAFVDDLSLKMAQ